MSIECTLLLMASMVRPRAGEEIRMTLGATKRTKPEGGQMKKPQENTSTSLFANLPEFHCRSIIPTLPTGENATKAEVAEVGAMDTIGSVIGGLVHLEVEMVGDTEGEVEKKLLVCPEGGPAYEYMSPASHSRQSFC